MLILLHDKFLYFGEDGNSHPPKCIRKSYKMVIDKTAVNIEQIFGLLG
jgi:hypothetical protein